MGRSGNNEYDTRLLQYPITFVEIIFAVVLGASVLYFHEFLFPPDLSNLSPWALFTAYFTAITSWFGWHKSTIKYPYTVSWAGQIRAILDAIIVVTYVAILFFGSKAGSTTTNVANMACLLYLWGFVTVFSLYIVTGMLRRTEYHDPEASKIRLLISHGTAVLLGAIAYTIILKVWPQFLTTAVLWVSVLLQLMIMATFRILREWRDLPWVKKIAIAVDMDGVLVEQVIPVLAKLNQEMGVNLNKRDITDWEYPIGTTNIKEEIERAELEERFVRQMLPIEGAESALRSLSSKFDIVIATSRDPRTNPWNHEWLKEHAVPFDRLLNTRASGKTLVGVDLLIDDYPGNIEEFIRNGPSGRRAILFVQPWNRDITRISDLVESDKVRVAQSWQDVLALLDSCIPWMKNSKDGAVSQSEKENTRSRDLGRYRTKYLLLTDAFSLVINYFVFTPILVWVIVQGITNESLPLWLLILLSFFALFSMCMFIMFTVFMFKPDIMGNLRKSLEYRGSSDYAFKRMFTLIFPLTLWITLLVVFLSSIFQGANFMPENIRNIVVWVGVIWLIIIPISSLIKLFFIDEKGYLTAKIPELWKGSDRIMNLSLVRYHDEPSYAHTPEEQLTAKTLRIPDNLWKKIVRIVNNRLAQGTLDRPIVFAFYTDECNHCEIVDYREITTVKVKGNYPNGQYTYSYPGIKKQGFYPRKGTGKWFSGTLVVGDGIDLDEMDMKWMIRDQMDFRIKMDRDSLGQLSWKAYYADFAVVLLELQ